MSHLKYSRLLNYALRTPLATTREMHDVIWDILRFRAQGGRLTPDEIRARIGDDEAPSPSARRAGAVAVIPIWGVIAYRNFDASSGMTSGEFIAALFRQALRNEDVTAILFDINSPGGTVEGIPELADEIFKARGTKPMVAIANAQMGSAATYLGTQADEVVSIPSGETGSIGVYGLHEDYSAWLDKEGIKITTFQHGEHKLEGAPWAPLSDESKAFYQSRVDEAGRLFDAAVARARGVSVADVRKTFGQGRMFSAKDALKVGLIDRIATFEETVARLVKTSGRKGASTRALASDSDAVVVRLEAVESFERPNDATVGTPPGGDQAKADRDVLETAIAAME